MIRQQQETSSSYQELSDDVEQLGVNTELSEEQEDDQEDANSAILPDSSSASVGFSKSCLKNVFSVILLFIYLLLMAVAIFLVYQTIADFREKLKHPVMSVSYKEVPSYDAPEKIDKIYQTGNNRCWKCQEKMGSYLSPLVDMPSDKEILDKGIALYPGKAELLTCKHHYYDYIPPLVDPGQPGKIECMTQRVNYTAPFSNETQKHAIVVEGPRDVKKRELVFMQFHLNKTDQDFSAIDYLLFNSFQEFLTSPNKSEFMKVCESSYSSWKFSGGFRTWVKMSLVKTKEEDNRETVEFRQEISVVNYIERRAKAEGDQLFFVVFEWKDPFIQEVQDIVTANPWNMIALLCGIFLALFKAADFAKLSVKWMIKIRKRHLKRRTQVLNHIS